MPQLLMIAIAGAGAYLGYRWISRQLDKSRAKVATAPGGPRDLGPLELDPATGEYRPRGRP